jgi:type IV secretory pathway VirB3-like protein
MLEKIKFSCVCFLDLLRVVLYSLSKDWRGGIMRHKELFWVFCFLVFLGVNISFVVLVEYIILFLILLAIIHIKAKSVQQWFEQGEVLAKVGITCPECHSDRLWGGASLFAHLIKTWRIYPIKCRMCGHKWAGNGQVKILRPALAARGLELKII